MIKNNEIVVLKAENYSSDVLIDKKDYDKTLEEMIKDITKKVVKLQETLRSTISENNNLYFREILRNLDIMIK